jgi:hypothetical protein
MLDPHFIIAEGFKLIKPKNKIKMKTNIDKQIEKAKEKLAKLEAKKQAEIDKMKTVIINNVEYELKQHDNDKKLSEIIIPKGWRLLLPSEAMMLYERGLIDSTFWFYVKQTNKAEAEQGNVARFGAGSGRAYLDCGRNPSNANAALGVLLCRDLGGKK